MISLGRNIEEFRKLAAIEDSIPKDYLLFLSNKFVETFNSGGKIAFVGNGGSAAEAIHIAAEFIGKCVNEHEPLPVLSLNESQSQLTAISNDFGFKFTFSRPIKALLNENDILIILSTSGKSSNITEAINVSLAKGVETHLWTGLDSPNYPKVEIVKVPSRVVPRIQEMHLVWGHLLAEAVEELINFSDIS